jgi:hypothetical protein
VEDGVSGSLLQASSCSSLTDLSPLETTRAALVVGHPGHELKVLGWTAAYRPRAFILTDGSGRGATPRTSRSRHLLGDLQVSVDSAFGNCSDQDVYAAILRRDTEFFCQQTCRLAEAFVRHGINFVAGDALEGYNPTHDLCRWMINAAVTIAQRKSAFTITNCEFLLTESAGAGLQHSAGCCHFQLDDRVLGRKLACAFAYEEMASEVQSALDRCGKDYFATECFRRVEQPSIAGPYLHPPQYESWAEQRVAAGHYRTVIRHKEHVAPIMEGIRSFAEGVSA